MCSCNKRIPNCLQNYCNVTSFRGILWGNRPFTVAFYCETSTNSAQYSLIYPRSSSCSECSWTADWWQISIVSTWHHPFRDWAFTGGKVNRADKVVSQESGRGTVHRNALPIRFGGGNWINSLEFNLLSISVQFTSSDRFYCFPTEYVVKYTLIEYEGI